MIADPKFRHGAALDLFLLFYTSAALGLCLYANLSCSLIRYFVPDDDGDRDNDNNVEFDCELGEVVLVGLWCQEDCDDTTRGSQIVSSAQWQVARVFSTTALALLVLLEGTILGSLWWYIPKRRYRILGCSFLVAACFQCLVFVVLSTDECKSYECDIHASGKAVMALLPFVAMAALTCFIYAKGDQVEVLPSANSSKEPGHTSVMAAESSDPCEDEEKEESTELPVAPHHALQVVKEESRVYSES